MSELFGGTTEQLKNEAESLEQEIQFLEKSASKFREGIKSGDSVFFQQTDSTIQATGGHSFSNPKKQMFVCDKEGSTSKPDIILINQLLRQIDQLTASARNTDLTKALLISAQHSISQVEISKEKTILHNQTAPWVGIKKAFVRSISLIAIALTLFLLGWVSTKFGLKFPDIPIFRIGA